jgi:L-galactose dehydrogenase
MSIKNFVYFNAFVKCRGCQRGREIAKVLDNTKWGALTFVKLWMLTVLYKQLGKTDLQVSELGFGASPLGGVYHDFDPAEGERAVHAAIDQGINFFDVSPYYGSTLAEERLGRALEGRRNGILLATKCGRNGVAQFDFSADAVEASVHASLARLRTSYVDLLQVHDVEFGSFEQIVQETLPCLRRLQQQGLTRYVGITGYSLGMLSRIARATPVDTVLSYCHYNLMITDMDEVLTPELRALGVGLINASPLHMGLLTQEGAPHWHPGPPPLRGLVRRAVDLAGTRGISLPQLALRFSLDHPYVSTTLVGMATREQVSSNLQALNQQRDPWLVGEIQQSLGSWLNFVWPSGLKENSDLPQELLS